MAGTGAGLLAGLIGIGGGIVVVPVVYYGLTSSGVSIDQAVHVAVATSLAAILPASIVSFVAHWRSGNADIGFLRQWGPGIAIGVVAAQLTAPYVDGRLLAALFGFLCLVFAIRFAFPKRFKPLVERPPGGRFRHVAGLGIGAFSGFAGVGGGILTNIVMTLSGLPMHKSIGRAAAAGIVVRPLPPRRSSQPRSAASTAPSGPALLRRRPSRHGSGPAWRQKSVPTISVGFLPWPWRSAGSPSRTPPCDRLVVWRHPPGRPKQPTATQDRSVHSKVRRCNSPVVAILHDNSFCGGNVET